MRVIFMGSPEFAVPTLNALVAAGHEVVAVYTQPPRPAGRGKQLQPTAIEERARRLGIEVRSPKSLKSEEEQAAFAALVENEPRTASRSITYLTLIGGFAFLVAATAPWLAPNWFVCKLLARDVAAETSCPRIVVALFWSCA